MSEIKIAIENCNNISKGVISLEEEKLNIRYGMNGTGKSTLSTAISLFSQGKPMDDLKPFGSDDEIIPTISIDGDIQGVRVFNEEFVNNMVFKESTVIDNHDVLILRQVQAQYRFEFGEMNGFCIIEYGFPHYFRKYVKGDAFESRLANIYFGKTSKSQNVKNATRLILEEFEKLYQTQYHLCLKR